MRPIQTPLFDDPPVAHAHDGVGHGRCLFTVRRHQDGHLLFCAHALQQLENRVAGCGVQIARRLVGEDQARGVHQRARNRHALHLSAGKLVHHAVRKPVLVLHRQAAPWPWNERSLACQQQGNLNILNHAQGIQQLKRLENETDLLATQPGEPGFFN
jgi:hypothetical protein